MSGSTHETLEEALAEAREHRLALRDLAAFGPGHAIVAEVHEVSEGYELRDVSVEIETEPDPESPRFVVLRAEATRCPVCGRTATETGTWVSPGFGAGPILSGLDPATCVGCWDTSANYGFSPMEFRDDGSAIPIVRPE